MKTIWKKLIGVMILTLCMSMTVGADNTNTQEKEQKSRLVIDKAYKAVHCKAGEAVNLQVPLINKEIYPITDVVVTPIQDVSTAVYPFEIENTNLYDTVEGVMNPGEKAVVSFRLTTRKDVTSGYTKLNFTITYVLQIHGSEDEEQEIETQRSLYVRTVEAEKPNVEEEPEPKSEKEAPSDDNEGPSDDAGTYDGGDYEYDGGDSVAGSDEEKEGKSSTPRIIIEGFRTNPASVDAGSQFTIYLKIRNTSKKTSVENIMLTLQTPQAGENETATEAFLPTSGANTIYVESIAANSSREISIDMSARSDLVQKPYPIEAALKYEDNQANPFEETLNISVPVHQKIRFEVGNIAAAPEAIGVGEETNLTFNIYNMGKTKLYNVSARVEDASIATGEAFVGNLDAGATGNVDLMIQGVEETAGDGNVKITVSYEDQDGKKGTYETTCVLLVTAATDMDIDESSFDDEALDEGAEKSGGFPILPVIIAAAVVVIAGIVIWIRRKRRKEEEWANDILGSDKDELQ